MNICAENAGQFKKIALFLRSNYGGLSFFCAVGVGLALYLQHYELVSPCPLCIFQRIALMACGVLSLIALWIPLKRLVWLWPSLIVLDAFAVRRFIAVTSGSGFYRRLKHSPVVLGLSSATQRKNFRRYCFGFCLAMGIAP